MEKLGNIRDYVGLVICREKKSQFDNGLNIKVFM